MRKCHVDTARNIKFNPKKIVFVLMYKDIVTKTFSQSYLSILSDIQPSCASDNVYRSVVNATI